MTGINDSRSNARINSEFFIELGECPRILRAIHICNGNTGPKRRGPNRLKESPRWLRDKAGRQEFDEFWVRYAKHFQWDWWDQLTLAHQRFYLCAPHRRYIVNQSHPVLGYKGVYIYQRFDPIGNSCSHARNDHTAVTPTNQGDGLQAFHFNMSNHVLDVSTEVCVGGAVMVTFPQSGQRRC